jgi:hypothetical protein
MIALHPLLVRAYPWLRGIAYVQPGTILVGPTGEVLRIRAEDGGGDEVNAIPPRWSAAADPCATRRDRP